MDKTESSVVKEDENQAVKWWPLEEVPKVSKEPWMVERAIGIANYIIANNATVRQTAKAFGVSKSTVHKDVTKWNG